MITSIRGKLIFVGIDHAVVETGGLGYQVFAPKTVLAGLGELGQEVQFYTHMHIREDLLALYGFSTMDQRHLFETLLTVSGIGPKVALSMLSSGAPEDIRVAIAGGDTARLARVPGIGKKTAERLVLELKGKIEVKGVAPAASPGVASVNADLADTLAALGFSAAEANAAINALPADAPPTLEERLRLALKYFGSA